MEVWLKGAGGQFRFPVTPSEVGIDGPHKIETSSLANGSEVSMYGGKGLRRTTISSHFPSDKDRTYLDFYGFPSEWECVKTVENMIQSKGELRFIVTQTNINLPVKVSNFKYAIVDGSGDVEFTLDIIEHRPPVAKAWSPPSSGGGAKPNTNASDGKHHNNKVYSRNRPSVSLSSTETAKGKVHIVKHGDNLWDIAQKYYGDGRKYKKIKNAQENQKQYKSLKNDNVIYSGWKLVLP